MEHSPYLRELMRDQTSVINAAIATLSAVAEDFDAIVVTGVSGLLLGPTLAHLMRKRIGIVRKYEDQPGKGNHAVCAVESNMEFDDRWLFVDDLIASGETVKRVVCQMERHMPTTRMAGRYLYNREEYIEGGWNV